MQAVCAGRTQDLGPVAARPAKGFEAGQSADCQINIVRRPLPREIGGDRPPKAVRRGKWEPPDSPPNVEPDPPWTLRVLSLPTSREGMAAPQPWLTFGTPACTTPLMARKGAPTRVRVFRVVRGKIPPSNPARAGLPHPIRVHSWFPLPALDLPPALRAGQGAAPGGGGSLTLWI